MSYINFVPPTHCWCSCCTLLCEQHRIYIDSSGSKCTCQLHSWQRQPPGLHPHPNMPISSSNPMEAALAQCIPLIYSTHARNVPRSPVYAAPAQDQPGRPLDSTPWSQANLPVRPQLIVYLGALGLYPIYISHPSSSVPAGTHPGNPQPMPWETQHQDILAHGPPTSSKPTKPAGTESTQGTFSHKATPSRAGQV